MRGSRSAATVLWVVAYVASVYLGRRLVASESGLALFWPAAGVAAAWLSWACARAQRSLAVTLLVVATVVVNTTSGIGLAAAVAFGVANAVQGVVSAAWACRRREGEGASGRVVTLVAAVSLASFASAVPGMVAASLNGASIGSLLVFSWVARNLCGGFVIFSAYTAWVEVGPGRRSRGLRAAVSSRARRFGALEYAAALVVTAGVTGWVFGVQDQLPLAFVVMATTAWVGSRFSPVVAATHSVVVAVAVVLTTQAGHGPFASISSSVDRAVVVQLFALLYSVLVQLLAAGARDRHQLQLRAAASESRTREQNALLAAVLDVIHDGVVVVDDKGHFVLRNQAALAMSTPADREDGAELRSAEDYGLKNMDGTSLSADQVPSALALAGQTLIHREMRQVEPTSGQYSVYSVNAAPLRLEGHGGSGADRRLAVMSLRDVTDHHLQLQELEGFAGVVAHDLRNPIAAVMSWSEVVDDALDGDGVDVAAARRGVLRIFATAERALLQISELLAFSQSGNKPLAQRSIDLGALFEDVVAELRGPWPDLTVDVRDLGRVCGDESLIRHVVSNLVGNAAKYVAPGVSPHVLIEAVDSEGVRVVSVEDNGVGIAPEHRSRVFESFYRAPTGGTYPGTGLGLAICARVVERHGGRIWVEDATITSGTRVSFSLPLDQDRGRSAGGL